MKKFLFWLTLVLLIAALTIPVAAAPSASLSASKSTANAGDTVTVKVSVSSMDCKSGGVEVSFDSKVFELTGGKCTLSGTALAEFDTATKDGVFAFSSSTTVSGKVFEITLKVKDSAALGKSNVSVNLIIDGESTSKSVGITVACKHEYDNGCDATCNKCGEKRSISHDWDSGKTEKKVTCTQDGSKVYTCDTCGEKKTETQKAYGHDYDNACDTTCNNCGEKRSTTHKYSDKWTADKKQHWHKCTVCGDKKDAADHTPGAEPTETEPQTCTVCGYMIKPSLNHVHSLSQEWVTDETGHWHTCADCDMIPDFEEHAFDNECDKECNTCGFTRETEHVYQTQWTADADGHWHQCEFCGDRLETEPHIPGAEATEFEAQICTVCGFELTPMLHQHEYLWNYDAESHWQSCECEDVIGKAEHTWDEGTVTVEPTHTDAGVMEYSCSVCGGVKTEEIPVLPAQTFLEKLNNTVEVPIWALIAAGGGVILLCILCAVIPSAIGKKKSGKYSS